MEIVGVLPSWFPSRSVVPHSASLQGNGLTNQDCNTRLEAGQQYSEEAYWCQYEVF